MIGRRTGFGSAEIGKATLTAAILVLISQCHQTRLRTSSTIDVADPKTDGQLVTGFYGLEDRRWRWTARRFAVRLAPPVGAGQKGAKLQVQLFIPDGQIADLGAMTLTADIDDRSLPPETYTKGGQYLYVRSLPSELLRSNIVPILFSFDKAVKPVSPDGRELAAVVTNVGLKTN